MDENLSSQIEEIETLCSIYGPDWVTVDEAGRSYSITISEDKYKVSLYITLPPEYPSACAPTYELFAPELSGDVKQNIATQLMKIYEENAGDAVLFQWVEKLRDVLRRVQEQTNTHVDTVVPIPLTVTDMQSGTRLEPECVETQPLVITHGPIISDRKSSFQGHAAVVQTVEQVKAVVSMLLANKKVSNATHNILAYRIERVPGSFVQDCDDDGETHAGARLMHLLQVVGVVNAVVVVSRWYGGIQLGADRFRHINNAARQVLDLAGLIAAPSVKNKTTH